MTRDAAGLVKISFRNCSWLEMDQLEKILENNPKLREVNLSQLVISPQIISTLLQLKKLKVVTIGEIKLSLVNFVGGKNLSDIEGDLYLLEKKVSSFVLEKPFMGDNWLDQVLL